MKIIIEMDADGIVTIERPGISPLETLGRLPKMLVDDVSSQYRTWCVLRAVADQVVPGHVGSPRLEELE